MEINEIMDQHWAWCEDMEWHNKLPLEYLALIGSEVGEAANECRGDTPTKFLPEELADIILRVADFAKSQNIDLDQAIIDKMKYNRINGKKEGRVK